MFCKKKCTGKLVWYTPPPPHHSGTSYSLVNVIATDNRIQVTTVLFLVGYSVTSGHRNKDRLDSSTDVINGVVAKIILRASIVLYHVTENQPTQ